SIIRAARATISTLSLHDALPISDLLDQDDCVGFVRGVAGNPIGPVTELVRKSLDRTPDNTYPVLCAPCDLQAVKASGVTFIISLDRKSTRLNSSHVKISYAVFCS